MNDIIKVKYIGNSAIFCVMPGFGKGKIKPGDIVETTKENYNSDLKSHYNWELAEGVLKEKKTPEAKKWQKSQDQD